MGRPAFDLFAVEHLPEPHGAILTRGGDHVRVEPPTQSRDVVAVAGERVKKIAGERLPDVQAAVAIAAGQQPRLTANPLVSIETMTAYIVQVSLGDTPTGTLAYRTIFAVGMLLFVSTFLLNLVSNWLRERFREEYA